MSMHFVKCVGPETVRMGGLYTGKPPFRTKISRMICAWEGGGLSGYASSRSTNKNQSPEQTSLRICFVVNILNGYFITCASVSSLEPVCSLEPALWLHCLLLQGSWEGRIGRAQGVGPLSWKKVFHDCSKARLMLSQWGQSISVSAWPRQAKHSLAAFPLLGQKRACQGQSRFHCHFQGLIVPHRGFHGAQWLEEIRQIIQAITIMYLFSNIYLFLLWNNSKYHFILCDKFLMLTN